MSIPSSVAALNRIMKGPSWVPPASGAPGRPNAPQPGAADHQPASSTFSPVSTDTVRAVWPVNHEEQRVASEARGQALIEAYKNVGHVDINGTAYKGGPWPLKGK